MRPIANVALDILREALARRWFLAFAIALTVIHLGVAFGLRLDVVDGALAASRLFGNSLGSDIRPADVVLGQVRALDLDRASGQQCRQSMNPRPLAHPLDEFVLH